MDRAYHGAYSVEVIQTADTGVAEGKFVRWRGWLC